MVSVFQRVLSLGDGRDHVVSRMHLQLVTAQLQARGCGCAGKRGMAQELWYNPSFAGKGRKALRALVRPAPLASFRRDANSWEQAPSAASFPQACMDWIASTI